MEITCKGCGSKFIVPDEKIPKDKTVKIKCPKCGEKTVIEPEKDEMEMESISYSDEVLSDIYEDKRLALFVGENKEILEKILPKIEEMEYKLIQSEDVRDAVRKLRLYHFDLILIEEKGDIRENMVMKYLNRLPMAIRRKIFVVLLSNNFKTMDQMMAYALSVNLILNLQDVEKVKDILYNAIKKYETFYKPFFDIMKEIGKL